MTTKSWRRGAMVALWIEAAACSSTTNGVDAANDVVDVQSDAVADAVAPVDAAPIDASSAVAADVGTTDSSPSTDGGFPCGAMSCDTATQYCQVLRFRDADGGIMDDYRCDSFDIACPSDHSCSCLERSLKCINACTTGTGGVTAVCGT